MPKCRFKAFTLIEVLVVLAVLALLVAMLVPRLIESKAKANRISCVGRLKNIGLSSRIFTTDNGAKFPWQLSTNRNEDYKVGPGTKEFATNVAELWRHFAILSNEIGTPVILWCPADRDRTPARNWASFTNNRNLSYLVGLTASENEPSSILAGDRNLLLNGSSISNTLLIVTTSSNTNVAWDNRIHREAGNLSLGDGSVQQVGSDRLREQFRDAAASGRQTLVIP